MKDLFLDHSDFAKSKRALVAASVTLFVLKRLDLQSEHINLFELKLGVAQDQLVQFAIYVVVYFFLVFAFRSYRHVLTAGVEDAVVMKRDLGITNKAISVQWEDAAKLERLVVDITFPIVVVGIALFVPV